MTKQEMFETLVASEGVKIRFKDESPLMRVLGVMTFFMPKFMTSITTTFGDTIFFPSREWLEEDWFRALEVLCHELVHVSDYRAMGYRKWMFGVMYAMPQGLAVLALLSPFVSWWFLLALVMLAPIPAPWRKQFEMRGYAMTMAVHYWHRGKGIPQNLKQQIVVHFTGPEYYWMWPFKKEVAREVGRWTKMILCDEIQDQGEIYSKVRGMLLKARAGL